MVWKIEKKSFKKYYIENFRNSFVVRVEDLDDDLEVDLGMWYSILPEARDDVRRQLANYKFVTHLGYDCTETKK